MPNLILIASALLIFSCQTTISGNGSEETKEDPTEINFLTSDGVKIYGDLYETDKAAPIILLFHQGRSNARGEYNSIIPELIAEGFNVLSIDQRMGGQLYGNYNRTITSFEQNNFSFCDAYEDLQAALDYVLESKFSGKKILWGSSYSGSLAIRLGHNRSSEVDGILAFSPASGGPMQDCAPNDLFPSLKTPLLLLRPQSEMRLESTQVQFKLAEDNNHQVYIAENGTHGSSMLVTSRVDASVDENWKVVKSFLSQFK